MKTLLKIATIATMIMALAAVSVSAEEFKPKTDDSPATLQEKVNNRLAQRAANAEARELRTEEAKARFLELVGIYAPDMVDDFDSAYASHDAVHELLKSTRESFKEEAKDEFKAEFEALKTSLIAEIQAGTMTRDEAKAELTVLRETHKARIEANKAEWEAAHADIKTQKEAVRESNKVLKAELRTAIEAEDTDAAYNIIVDLHNNFLIHIDLDYDVLDLLEAELTPSL